MRVRQEQVVFAGALALLALLFAGTLKDSAIPGSRGARGGRSPELERYATPDVSRALPRPREAGDLSRSLFEPPRDTEKLPPLLLEPPPRGPLAALRPPAGGGPKPSLFDEFLRVPAPTGTVQVEGLFVEEEAPEESSGEEFEPQGGAESLSANERVAQIQGYMRSYDWLRMPGFRWGQIRNKDRFTLASRPDEPIRWVEFDPETGAERFPGQPPIEIARDRIDELGFAQTPENEIEEARIEFRGELTPGQYPRVLELARWCLARHPEAANALEAAEELFTRAQKVSGGDSAAWLGLARCHEMGYRFEDAYQVYRNLLESGRAEDPMLLARLAELLARFRLYDRAEGLLRDAERYGRNEWEVQWAFGRYLLERGRSDEAREHLEAAARLEPTLPERQRERAGIRADLATAMLHQGDLTGAASWFRKAQQADPDHDERALAGMLSVHYLEGSGGSDGNAPLVDEDSLARGGFELQLVEGLLALQQGDLAGAAIFLEQAAELDPLRASQAWRALSYLAEVGGYAAEALRFAEQAVENDPTDVYALIQRGRVLSARDDVEGALDSFTRALDQVMYLPDVAAAMGEIFFRDDRHEEAERYLEGAILLDDGVAAFHTLRGLNQLELGRVVEAEASFLRALELDRSDPTARCGLAWCEYLKGEVIEAQTLYRELDDARRDLPEDDPFRVYARRQIDRISDHQQKVVWKDDFERQSIMNDWSIEGESFGPTIDVQEGAIRIDGAFSGKGRARIKRAYAAGDFVSFEATLTVSSVTNVRVGVFASLERSGRGGGGVQVTSEISLSRNPDSAGQTRVLRRGEDDLPYQDVPLLEWPAGEPVVLRIERTGESSDTRFSLWMDGLPVLENVQVPAMGATNNEMYVGVFAEGETGRHVGLGIDEVRVVKRQR